MKTKTQQIHYDVGQVDVQVNHSHKNKLKVLKMTMENWQYNDGSKLPLDSKQGRLFEADLHKLNELIEESNVHGQEDFLTKEQMEQLNVIFKTYGGIRNKGYDKRSNPKISLEESLWDNVTIVKPDNS
jgi:hypothetical protein